MFETLEQALQILGLGWGGVFLVMLVIYLYPCCSPSCSRPQRSSHG